MIVEVYHDATHVASVDVRPILKFIDALEYAYRWTQNIEGSWSKPGNADSNENVTVRAPLPVHPTSGRIMGLRSSMVGDRFTIGDRTWRVASFGFEEAVDA
jgi:hypothetical protein